MSDWFLQTPGWAEIWSQALGRVLWQGGLVLLLAWLVCRFVPGLPARVKCWLWRLAYLKLVLAFFWAEPVLLPVLRAEREPEPVALIHPFSDPMEVLVKEKSAIPTFETADAPFPKVTDFYQIMVSPAPANLLLKPEKESETFLSGWMILLMIWLTGVLGLGLGQLLEWRRLRKMIRLTRPVQKTWMKDEVNRLCVVLGLSNVPRLRAGGGLSSPVLVGVMDPVIVIPEDWVDTLEPGPGRMMLAHELVHLKRRDLVWNWLPAVARTLFFFHPLVWMFLKEWRLAQEMACDEQAVLAGRVSPADYGGMLVSVVARCGPVPGPKISHFSAGILESKETLKRRLKAMKVIRSLSFPRLVLWAGVTFCAGSLLLVPWRLTAQESDDLAREPVRESTDDFNAEDPFGGGDEAHREIIRYTTKSHVTQQHDAVNLEVLRAQMAAVEAEMDLAEHRLQRMSELNEKNAVSDQEVVKARAEFARARANAVAAQARLDGWERNRVRQDQMTEKDRIIEILRREVLSLKRQIQRSSQIPMDLPPPHDPFGHDSNIEHRIQSDSDDGDRPARQVVRERLTNTYRISQEQLDQERQLIEEEIELAERQLEIQLERFKAGQVTEDQVLQLRREILSLKRQEIRLGRGVSAVEPPARLR